MDLVSGLREKFFGRSHTTKCSIYGSLVLSFSVFTEANVREILIYCLFYLKKDTSLRFAVKDMNPVSDARNKNIA